MKEPLTQFRTEEELKNVKNTRASALRVRGYVGCLIPVICMACAGAFVMAVMKMDPPKSSSSHSKAVVSKSAAEKESEAATKKAATERQTLANLSADSAAGNHARDIQFEVGDEVQAVEDCRGFAEETDLNAFRSMLRHGDAAKAGAYFDQLSGNRKAIKLPALLRMTVAASAWNGSQQVIVGTEQWWVAKEWLEPASDDSESEESTPQSVDRRNRKLSEISASGQKPDTDEDTAKELEKMKNLDAPAADGQTE